MKILTIVLFIALFSLCACGQTLKIMWDPTANADNEGLKHYVIYKWEGDSTQWDNWQESDLDSIGIVPHVSNFSGPYEFTTYFAEDKIIQGGAAVEDSLGRRSGIRVSKFYFFPSGIVVMWPGR